MLEPIGNEGCFAVAGGGGYEEESGEYGQFLKEVGPLDTFGDGGGDVEFSL